MQDRLPLARLKDRGSNLQSVQQLIKKNQVSRRGGPVRNFVGNPDKRGALGKSLLGSEANPESGIALESRAGVAEPLGASPKPLPP